MDFTFSFGWMIAGLVIAAAGGAIVFFYRQIAHGLVNGISSYDRVKLVGIITIVVGLLIAMNLHLIIIEFLFGLVTGKL